MINEPQVRRLPEEFRQPEPVPQRNEEKFQIQKVIADEED